MDDLVLYHLSIPDTLPKLRDLIRCSDQQINNRNVKGYVSLLDIKIKRCRLYIRTQAEMRIDHTRKMPEMLAPWPGVQVDFTHASPPVKLVYLQLSLLIMMVLIFYTIRNWRECTCSPR